MPLKSAFPPDTVFVDDEGRGKKYALRKGITAATTEYVWLLDDDVQVPVDPMVDTTDADMLILPLKMTEGNGSLHERLQQTEYAAIQTLTMLAADRGRAVMCSGANLIVRRARWIESWHDLHPDILSGDDMFLLESFKRRGLRIKAICAASCIATVEPSHSLRGLLRQRMRWAGKAPHYTDRDILRCGTMVVIANLLSVVCPLLWPFKFIAELRLLRHGRQRYHLIDYYSPWVALLLSVLYPWYMLLCLAGGLLRKQW